jgi:hypothetical protein
MNKKENFILADLYFRLFSGCIKYQEEKKHLNIDCNTYYQLFLEETKNIIQKKDKN